MLTPRLPLISVYQQLCYKHELLSLFITHTSVEALRKTHICDNLNDPSDTGIHYCQITSAIRLATIEAWGLFRRNSIVALDRVQHDPSPVATLGQTPWTPTALCRCQSLALLGRWLHPAPDRTPPACLGCFPRHMIWNSS